MTQDALRRANDIESMLSQINGVYIDKFANGKAKVYTKDINGIYFDAEIANQIVPFFEELKLKYKKELEEL